MITKLGPGWIETILTFRYVGGLVYGKHRILKDSSFFKCLVYFYNWRQDNFYCLHSHVEFAGGLSPCPIRWYGVDDVPYDVTVNLST